MASMLYGHTRKHATPSPCDQWTLRNSFGEDKLYVIEDVFTYQDFFSQVQGYELDKYVKEFYSLR